MKKNHLNWKILLLLLFAGIAFYMISAFISILKNRDIILSEDSYVEIDLSAGRSKGKRTDFEIDKLPKHGWLEGKPPLIVYHPKENYFGQDQIDFSEVINGKTRQSAIIFLTIQGVNDPPQIQQKQVLLKESTSVPILLGALDSDSKAFTYSILEKPAHGILSGENPQLIYTPEAGYFGEDRLIFIASDRQSQSQPGIINIIVAPQNSPPTVNLVSLRTYQNIPLVVDFDGSDSENDQLSYEIIKKSQFGSLKKKGEQVVYYPNGKFIGQDSFSYRAFDGVHYSQPANVDINVQESTGKDDLSQVLGRVIEKGGVALGRGTSQDFIFQKGRYVPASVLKLVTALAAIHYLGEDARFQTEFFLDKERNLYIKGYADPSLTAKEWKRIAAELVKMGIFNKPIRSLVLDDTAIEKGTDFDGRGKTLNYFDAPIGALPTNYNMIAVKIKPNHRIVPWKRQPPVTEIIRHRARGLPNGYQRFSVATDPENGTRYTGEVVKAIFQKMGATNIPLVRLGTVPFSLGPFYIHDSSHDLEDVIKTMLHESSNFIANQLLLVMAIDKYGEQAQLSQGVNLLKQFSRKQIGLKSRDFRIVEGSGLSRKNRMDLQAMLEVVNSFEGHRDLLPNLSKSKYFDLVEIGRRWNIKAKTGTMKGIATLAGFLQKKNKRWLPFVIMLEGKPADRALVLEIICRYYAG